MTMHLPPDHVRLAHALQITPRSHDLFINGRYRPALDGRVIERHSPAHGVLVSTYARAGDADLEAAIRSAHQAFETGPWPKTRAGERASILLKAADLFEARLEEIATLDTLESGKPIAQARGEIAAAADIWRYAAALARTLGGESYNTLGEAALGVVVRDPVGVVSIITPWNFPFLIVSQKLPFALAAGCTAVVKPSEMTSASTLLLGGILAEAGLPDGVCNIVAGLGPEIGPRMTADARIDMVSFTGSTRVGKGAMAAASATLKKVSMELGGKNPQIIFPDADLDAALDAALFGAFFNAGECCNAGSRLIVHRDIADSFEAAFIARAKTVSVGDPLNEATKVGALISADHLALVESHVAKAVDAGARLALGGRRLAAGAGQFMAPTVVAGVSPDMGIARDEVFGPVLAILPFDTATEAIGIANGVDYGLSASVWSRDFDTCVTVSRRLRAGTVWTNTFMDGAAELPFGGYRQSGLGRELGRRAVEDYTEEKTLHLHCGPRTAWWLPRTA